MKNIEILAPAGSYESLKAAIAAGADAVYVGGTRFGARAFADNFDMEKMLEAIDYVHLHGKKIYLTINTLLKTRELERELYAYLLPYYQQGLDAVIVQDIGVLSFVKEQFPDLPIHASTQMTVTNVLGAKFLEKQGVERVVTAREMQLDEIREIAEETNLEIESFVHGALCYCYSGQCLYSSMLGGRSGNRGQCAQPCRLPYRVQDANDAQYWLSLKDICTLDLIPELVECGIHSFKIEGRMKKPEYVALVTAMYRKYLDRYLHEGKAQYRVDEKDKEQLMDLYNRGGFHDGYYRTRNGREMISLTRPNHAGVPALKVLKVQGKEIRAKACVTLHRGDVIEMPDGQENYTCSNTVNKGQEITIYTHKRQNVDSQGILYRVRNEQLLQEIDTMILKKEPKLTIKGGILLCCDAPARLLVEYNDRKVEVFGDVVQRAQNHPMDASRVESQIKKTGNTPFVFGHLDIDVQGAVFFPMQSLNQLRRDALQQLEEKIVMRYRRKEPECRTASRVQKGNSNSGTAEKFAVYVEEMEQFYEVLSSSSVGRIYIDSHAMTQTDIRQVINEAHGREKEIFLAMPYIFRKQTRRLYERKYHDIMEQDWDGVLIRNLESYEFLKDHRFLGNIVTDYNLYQMNPAASAFWLSKGVESLTAPLELNDKELGELGLADSELVIYGYYPMMISAQCIKKTNGMCNGTRGRLTFTDRYHKKFTVKNQCASCYNVIYNAEPVILMDQVEHIRKLAPKALRLHFTIEDGKTVREILKRYEDAFYGDGVGREFSETFTRGHFKRGVK